MAEEKKDSKSKAIIILLIIIIVLLAGGGIITFILLSNNAEAPVSDPDAQLQITDPANTAPVLGYEAGAMALDKDSLQRAVDEAFRKTEDGYITLDFFNEAYSSDGENFQCRIGNDPSNTVDMYVSVYADNNFSELLYLSGLIRPGEGIANFKTEKKLDPGTYETILVLTQVEDDHATLKSETSVVLQLKVGDQNF